MKKQHLIGTVVFLVLSAAFSGAKEPVPAAGRYTGACSVDFSAESNLHPFGGKIPAVPVSVELKPDGKMNAEVRVRVITMTSHRKQRDKQMWEMFEAGRFPFFSVTVRDASFGEAHANAGEQGRLPLTFSIAGKTSTAVADTSDIVMTPEGGSFAMTIPLSLKKIGLTAPTAMGGLIRVKDPVVVKCRVTLQKAAD